MIQSAVFHVYSVPVCTYSAVSFYFAGTYGVPVYVCARAMFTAVAMYSHKHAQLHSIQDIHIVTLAAESIGMMIVVMQQLMEEKGMQQQILSFFLSILC